MAAITYNNYLRQLLSKCECILAFDTAADFLGLTNGGNRSTAQIFVTKKQDAEVTESLANFYEEHGEFFDGLRILGHLIARFEKYSNWAKEYYE